MITLTSPFGEKHIHINQIFQYFAWDTKAGLVAVHVDHDSADKRFVTHFRAPCTPLSLRNNYNDLSCFITVWCKFMIATCNLLKSLLGRRGKSKDRVVPGSGSVYKVEIALWVPSIPKAITCMPETEVGWPSLATKNIRTFSFACGAHDELNIDSWNQWIVPQQHIPWTREWVVS